MKKKLSVLPIVFTATLFLLLNWYVLSGLMTVIQQHFFPSLFWLIIISSTATAMYVIANIQKLGTGLFFKIATHVALIIFTVELLFSSFLVANDGYRLLSGIYSLLTENSFTAVPRNEVWIQFALLISLLMLIIFIYGIVKGKYRYRTIKHTLYFDDLPIAFDGFKLVQISDVHAGSLNNPKAVQKGIDLINRQQADLFVFTGDLVNNTADEIERYIKKFAQIKAPFGQFSVLGNHDYGDYLKWPTQLAKQENLEKLKNHHAEIGFKLLLDEHVSLQKDDEKIILAGVENWGLGFGERGDLNKALAGTTTEDFKVLLSHDPTHWEAQVKNHAAQVHLTLAGHTHGMQFGIEAFGIKWSPVQMRYKHWAGIKEENNSILNVNRGFGFIGFSGRIGIWPEISVIELRRR